MDKLLALMSSEMYNNGKDLFTVSVLNPRCEVNDVVKTAPLAAAAFVDDSVLKHVSQPLVKMHIALLQDLIQETLQTEDDVWNRATELAKRHELATIVSYVNNVRSLKDLNTSLYQNQPIDSEYVLALYIFINNNDKPDKALEASRRCSSTVSKLVIDMCMASYGLSWLLKARTQEYIVKHNNTYVLSC
jgi:hypothetical protein